MNIMILFKKVFADIVPSFNSLAAVEANLRPPFIAIQNVAS